MSTAISGNGLHQIYPQDHDASASATVDIIAIHGLGTTSQTWERDVSPTDGQAGRRVNWLTDPDMLPAIAPTARILTFGWNARYYENAPVSRVEDVAEVLLRRLQNQRDEANAHARPLIFIASCFGGLVLTKALDIANISDSPYQQIRLATTGIVFLGTPLQGTRAGTVAQWHAMLGSILQKDPSDTLLQDLDGGTKALRETSERFYRMIRTAPMQPMITCFWEMQKSQPLKKFISSRILGEGTKQIIVEKDSACLFGLKDCIGLDASHFTMNKYSGPHDGNYKLVSSTIKDMMYHANEICRSQREGSTTANEHFMVSRQVNTRFTGRHEELETLQQILLPSNPVDPALGTARTYVIYGMGGAGKSEVALKFAYDNRKSFWGVFWIDASNESSAIRGFERIAKKCSLSEQSLEAVMDSLQDATRPWLLVLDNADDPEFDYARFLPTGERGSIIITSRVKGCTSHQTVGFDYYERLGREAGIELLLNICHIGTSQRNAHEADAEQVADLLGFHALALNQAGAFIREGNCTLDQYPELFRNHQDELLAFHPSQAKSIYGNAYATLDVSAAHLERRNDRHANDALELLNLVAFMHYEDVPEILFEEAWDEAQRLRDDPFEKENQQISKLSAWHSARLPKFMAAGPDQPLDKFRLGRARSLLASLSIVSLDPATGMMRMHLVAHMWAQYRLKNNERAPNAWLGTFNLLALSTVYFIDNHTLSKEFLSHIDSVSKAPEGWEIYKDDFNFQQAAFRLVRGLHKLRSYSTTPQVLRFIPVHSDPAWLRTANGQLIQQLHAICLADDGYQLQAKLLLEQLLAIQSDSDDVLAASSAQNLLATVLLDLREEPQAARLLEEVVAIRSAHFAPSDSRLLIAQRNLASVYSSMNNASSAITLLEQVLFTQTLTLPSDDQACLDSQYELARAYRKDGQLDKAIALYEQIVDLDSRRLRPDHPDLLCAQFELGSLYRERGELPKAIDLVEHVVRSETKTLHAGHPRQVSSRNLLADVYAEVGRNEEVLQLLLGVLALEARTLSAGHADGLKTQVRLAECYYRLGRQGDGFGLAVRTAKMAAAGCENPWYVKRCLEMINKNGVGLEREGRGAEEWVWERERERGGARKAARGIEGWGERDGGREQRRVLN